MTLREELLRIREQSGVLTPRHVLEAARAVEHPLHERFEWDDSAAAEAHRLDQAHRLIRSVRVVWREATESEPARRLRCFHAIPDPELGRPRYEPHDEVVRDAVMRNVLMASMAREWMTLLRRYRNFEEFWAMVREAISGEQAA